MRKHDPALDHIGSHIGKATGIAAVLRGIPVVATAGSGAVVLPLDVCAEFGLRQEDVIRRPGSAPALRDAVFKVATLANDHLITARKMLAEAGPEATGSAFATFLSAVRALPLPLSAFELMRWADPRQPVSPEIGESRLQPLQPLSAAEALDPSVAAVPGIRIQDVLD